MDFKQKINFEVILQINYAFKYSKAALQKPLIDKYGHLFFLPCLSNEIRNKTLQDDSLWPIWLKQDVKKAWILIKDNLCNIDLFLDNISNWDNRQYYNEFILMPLYYLLQFKQEAVTIKIKNHDVCKRWLGIDLVNKKILKYNGKTLIIMNNNKYLIYASLVLLIKQGYKISTNQIMEIACKLEETTTNCINNKINKLIEQISDKVEPKLISILQENLLKC